MQLAYDSLSITKIYIKKTLESCMNVYYWALVCELKIPIGQNVLTSFTKQILYGKPQIVFAHRNKIFKDKCYNTKTNFFLQFHE